MPIFSQGDVLRVPFPYVERPILQRRPAAVISDGDLGRRPTAVGRHDHKRRQPALAGDISLADSYARFGLPQPCVIRPAKVATIEARDVDRIGALDETILATLRRTISSMLRLHAID